MKHEHLDDTRDPRDREIDDALGLALRAEDPGAAFTQRVLARAREERSARRSEVFEPFESARSEVMAGTEVSPRTTPEVFASAPESVSAPGAASERSPAARAIASRTSASRFTATRKLIAAIAASLTLAAVGTQYLQHRRYVAEGERARAQVLEALRLTNQKLNIVHERITGREPVR